LGGEDVGETYGDLFKLVVSSGFVVCAPTHCTGGQECRDQSVIDLEAALTAAKLLGATGMLPIQEHGPVGIMGHSTGGMTTMKNAYKKVVSKHGIKVAVMYNGDGGQRWLKNDNMKWSEIEPTLPLLFIAGTNDGIEPKEAMPTNVANILAANPTQPYIAAMIAGENHFDSVGHDLNARLRGGSAAVAFLSMMLKPNDACNEDYKSVLGDQLAAISPTYYDNTVFDISGPTVLNHNWDICHEQLIRLPQDAGTIGWRTACPWKRGSIQVGLDLTLSAAVPAALLHTKIQLRVLNSIVALGNFEDTVQCVELELSHVDNATCCDNETYVAPGLADLQQQLLV
jgi:dienelactone hydrolase